MNKIYLFLVAIFISGCSASSHILVGETRTPINASQVRVLVNEPAEYELIAIVESSSKFSIAVTEQGKIEAVLEELKIEAAKLGANGLLLDSVNNESVLVPVQNPNGSVSHYSGSNKVIKAKAIYIDSD
ncbi:hypothetical protein SAMN05216361_3623 [Marisediminitalea aggregata]|uniref:Lipoprotein n=1 Tax=Marisediminitalea aggregata TaxID=634436 RepID=A0A1M5PVP1_9ALTE|nr:hypothetical protein [Marisediminitalea aggregata]SHH05904.1 hypothetical protein SAMN05216361_3623 [Marisediminitalea aggregata]